MLELMRNVLDDALHNHEFREALNQIYRKRVLETHLASLPIFENAPEGALHELGRRAELVTFTPGSVIFNEGDEPDAMYFVRMGTVKLFRGGNDGRVLGYRSRGDWVGLASLLAETPRRMTAVAHAHLPASALAHGSPSLRQSLSARVELVRISGELFHDVCHMYPDLDRSVRALLAEQSQQSNRPGQALAVESLAGALGLSQGEKLMLIDLDHCTRCGDCVRACADTHAGIPLLTRSGPRFGSYLVPGTCRQCLDPVCLLGCPVGSIHRGTSGEIVIKDWCIGCGLCSEQCPYDAITLSEAEEGETRKAHACDQCSSLGVSEPLCVRACAHDAAHRVDGRTFFMDWEKRS
jgi:Fe-S-cluster-containing hydrogenase component 2